MYKSILSKQFTLFFLFISLNLGAVASKKNGDYKILALGESSHGVKEFFDIKFDIIDSIADKEQIVVSFETNRISGYILDLYVSNQIQMSDDELAKHVGQGIYQVEEFINGIKRIKEKNKHKPNGIRIRGIDVVSPLTVLYESIWLSRYYKDTLLTNRLLFYDSIFRDIQFWNNNNLAQDLRNIHPYLDTFIIGRSNQILDDLIHVTHKSLYQSSLFLPSRTLYGSNRDSIMALNAIYITEREFSGVKQIMWNHNLHVCKNAVYKSFNMGKYLKNYFDQDYYVIGFYFASGTALGFGDLGFGFYTLEEIEPKSRKKISQCGDYNHFLPSKDLKGRIKLATYGVSLNKPRYKKMKIERYYDALFFVNIAHPSTPLNTPYNKPNCYITLVKSKKNTTRFDSIGFAISALPLSSNKPFEYGVWIGELNKARGGKSIYKTDSFFYKDRAQGFGFNAEKLRKIKSFDVQFYYEGSVPLVLDYVAVGLYRHGQHLVTHTMHFNSLNDLEKVKVFRFKANIIKNINGEFLSIEP